jgi:hypothetical protein
MNTAKRVATSLVTLLLVGWSVPAIAQQDKVLQKVIEGAKKEAKLGSGQAIGAKNCRDVSGALSIHKNRLRAGRRIARARKSADRIGGGKSSL